jgi:hypothetical protein
MDTRPLATWDPQKVPWGNTTPLLSPAQRRNGLALAATSLGDGTPGQGPGCWVLGMPYLLRS